jgi:hypothetical protein
MYTTAGMQGPPPLQHIQDPEALRHEYKRILVDLTFNSKPIITNLTILAQENKQGASMIVREIEQQIRTVSVFFKS